MKTCSVPTLATSRSSSKKNPRKAIEGECPICIDDLSGFLPVCYCRSCGQNFHTKCLDDWLQRKATCPVCYVDRPITIDLVQSRLWDAANGEPWDVYMQWLYTGIIPVHLKGLDDHGAKHCQLLMVSHALGERLEDELFQKALQKEIVEDIRISLRAIGYHNIRQVYQQFTNGASTLRKVLVDLYIANADSTKLDL